MQAGLASETLTAKAESEYLDPSGDLTGQARSLQPFCGLTSEVRRYLRERLGAEVNADVKSTEAGNGLRWWYVTRVGAHAEDAETPYNCPIAACSHFLFHAYVGKVSVEPPEMARPPVASRRRVLDSEDRCSDPGSALRRNSLKGPAPSTRCTCEPRRARVAYSRA